MKIFEFFTLQTSQASYMCQSYGICSVINSHISTYTCWFYSRDESSVHGHELLTLNPHFHQSFQGQTKVNMAVYVSESCLTRFLSKPRLLSRPRQRIRLYVTICLHKFKVGRLSEILRVSGLGCDLLRIICILCFAEGKICNVVLENGAFIVCVT